MIVIVDPTRLDGVPTVLRLFEPPAAGESRRSGLAAGHQAVLTALNLTGRKDVMPRSAVEQHRLSDLARRTRRQRGAAAAGVTSQSSAPRSSSGSGRIAARVFTAPAEDS